MGKSKKSFKMDWGKDIPEADAKLCLLCKHAARDATSSNGSDAASVAVSNDTSAAASATTDPTIARLGRVCTFQLNDKSYLAHRNCLYASPSLGNNDVLHPGCAFGFVPAKIHKEALRGKNLSCFLCKKKGAVHGCSKKSCRRSFHLYCAVKCNLLCLFKKSHFVYCEKHAVGFLAGTDYVQEDQATSSAENNSGAAAHDSKECCFCKMHAFENDAMETGVGDPRVQLKHAHVKATAEAAKRWTALRLTCCQRTSNDATENYAHRWCLERFSERKGMKSLRCPNCLCYEPFLEYLARNGIFLEEKPNDDDELMPDYVECTADVCRVAVFGEDEKKNRTLKENEGSYDIGSCNGCGRHVHSHCAYSNAFSLPYDETEADKDDFYCDVCFDKLQQRNQSPKQEKLSPSSSRAQSSSVSACSLKSIMKPQVAVSALPLSPLPPNVDSSSGNDAGNDDANADGLNLDDDDAVLNAEVPAVPKSPVRPSDDADLNERAASRASSRSSSSASLYSSALSVHSLMSNDDDESSKPVKRAKLDAGPSTVNLSVKALSQPASFMRSAGNRKEALSSLLQSDAVEKRSIRFGLSDGKMRLLTTGDSAHGVCRSCGRAEKGFNRSIATQTDDPAPNDEASTSFSSTRSSDATPSNAVDADKSLGGVPSSLERSAAAEEDEALVGRNEATSSRRIEYQLNDEDSDIEVLN